MRCSLYSTGLFRTFCEFFRLPDTQLGYVLGPLSMGQVLSLIMAVMGLFLKFYLFPYLEIVRRKKRKSVRRKKRPEINRSFLLNVILNDKIARMSAVGFYLNALRSHALRLTASRAVPPPPYLYRSMPGRRLFCLLRPFLTEWVSRRRWLAATSRAFSRMALSTRSPDLSLTRSTAGAISCNDAPYVPVSLSAPCCRRYRAAFRVAKDDDEARPEMIGRILYASERRIVDDVSGEPDDEEIADPLVKKYFGRDAGIRASYNYGKRLLACLDLVPAGLCPGWDVSVSSRQTVYCRR